MAIKGCKKARIQYASGKCNKCGKMVTVNYLKKLTVTSEGNTYSDCGICQDCRADAYNVAPNAVWDYEETHQVS